MFVHTSSLFLVAGLILQIVRMMTSENRMQGRSSKNKKNSSQKRSLYPRTYRNFVLLRPLADPKFLIVGTTLHVRKDTNAAGIVTKSNKLMKN
jgi:hypothetical protein